MDGDVDNMTCEESQSVEDAQLDALDSTLASLAKMVVHHRVK